MNNFKKEELGQILFDMDEKISNLGEFFISEDYLQLREKVCNMIDNYCEHTEEYEDFNYAPMRCKECGEITG